MCKMCWDNATTIFPEFSEDDIKYVLVSLTAFPFSDAETTKKQLLELRQTCMASIPVMSVAADQEMDMAYREFSNRDRMERRRAVMA